MSSVSPEVLAYLDALQPEQRAAVETLRQTIREILPDADEVITYGVPTFKLGRSVVAYAGARNHYSLYPMSSELIGLHAAELGGYSTSSGTIRFRFTEPLPAELVKTLVRERLAQNAARDAKKKSPAKSTGSARKRRDEMIETSDPATQPAHREVTLVREFDAPRELVFKVWTEAEHLARWWGPHHFTNPVCEIDARKDGAILIHMQGPDGVTYPMTGVINEIVPPERLVFLAWPRDLEGNALAESLTRVTFEDLGGKTRLTVQASAVGLAPIAAQMLAGMQEGWSQSLERLGELLAQLDDAKSAPATADREIVIERVFDAPREAVFQAFIDPDQVVHWWGPRGFTTTTHSMDVRPGGRWVFVMHGPGTDYDNVIEYTEIVPSERLTYHHGSGDDPGQFDVTVTFVDQAGKTALSMRSLFRSVEERNFVVEKYHAIEGGNQTLDRLGEFLAHG